MYLGDVFFVLRYFNFIVGIEVLMLISIGLLFQLLFTGYVIERADEGGSDWQPMPDVVSGTSHTVKGLKKDKKYKFRVRAENVYGLSNPVETDKAILAKNPYGNLL